MTGAIVKRAWLLTALRALDLSEERAFLIAAAIVPAEFSGAESIRLFLSRYRLLDREAAIRRTKAWRTRIEPSGGGTGEAGAVRTEASG